jgi:hypothetical protein
LDSQWKISLTGTADVLTNEKIHSVPVGKGFAMYYQDRLVDLLDRKFKLVNELPPRDFLLEIGNFVDFILGEETLEPYARQLVHQFQRRESEYQRALEGIKEQLVQLRQDFVALFPHLDDSQMQLPDFTDEYLSSLARFDAIVKDQPTVTFVQKSQNVYDPPKGIADLIPILLRKFGELEQTEDSQKLKLSLSDLSERLSHLHREYVNYKLVSPGYSFHSLQRVTDMIKRDPPPYPSQSDLLTDWRIDSLHDRLYTGEKGQRVASDTINEDVDNRKLIEHSKILLRRAYEGIRAALGSHLIHYEILLRYKARCMWYDRRRLERLVKENEEKQEDVLTRDLALYLFDNGISTLYRVRRGKHEYDLIGDQAKARIFVEVKVYKDSKNARRDLTQGIAQLHAYLNGLEADDMAIQEVYYVIYRLGGRLYDLPEEIPTNRRTFYPVIVDLGPSRESGSRQPKPISIPLDDFFEQIESGVETLPSQDPG